MLPGVESRLQSLLNYTSEIRKLKKKEQKRLHLKFTFRSVNQHYPLSSHYHHPVDYYMEMGPLDRVSKKQTTSQLLDQFVEA